MDAAEIRKLLVPEVVFGIDARKLAGRRARLLGACKVLLVTDPGVIAAGWAADVAASLEGAGLPFVLHSGVTPNPRVAEVMAGADVYRTSGCDVIVAVGGGSVIDCAKGIGIVSSNGRSIMEFEGADHVEAPMPPIICIPTTGGTSADVSQFAVIFDPTRHVKFAIVGKAVVPDLALVDPVTLTTMDRHLAACTGVDALVHAIEAFASNASSHLTDVYALDAVRLINSNLLGSLEQPGDLGLRTAVMQGSLEAGIAFSNASLGAVHAMSHSLGGYMDLIHGECTASVLLYVLDFNLPAAEERFRQIAEAMGVAVRGMTDAELRKALFAAAERFLVAAGLKAPLHDKGVRSSDVPELAEHALEDVCMVTNPRPANRRDIEVLYEESL